MTKVKKEISNRFGDKVCSAGHVTRRELSDFYSQKKKKKKRKKRRENVDTISGVMENYTTEYM